MKDEVCSSILVDLNIVGRGLGEEERSLFNAISFVMICYRSCSGLVVSQLGGWVESGQVEARCSKVAVSERNWCR